MIRSVVAALAVLACALAHPATARGQVAPPAAPSGAEAGLRDAPTVRRRVRVRPGQRVEVDIVRGVVRVERVAGTDVEIIATRRATRSDPGLVRLELDTSATGIRFVDRYPPLSPAVRFGVGRECLPPDADGRGDFWHSDVQIEVVLRVPPDVPFSTRVMAGETSPQESGGPGT